VYDIGSTIKYEKGIKLFSINLSTSVKNVETTIQLIDNIIEEIKLKAEYFDADKISKNSKRNKIKTELNEERAIVLCKNLTTNEIMFGNIECTDEINEEDIHRVINKVLINPSIQVIKS
jgi:predicted Zn-dependent peptidase